jgi:hypothetical protein
MAEASAHKLSYVAESVRGTTPTNPRFKALPDTRTTLALTRENLTSERLTGDRFPSEPRSGANGVSGDIPVDLSSRAYDDFISSALQGAWVESGSADTADFEVDAVPDAGKVQGDTFATTNGVVTIERLDSKAQQAVLRYDPTITAAATSHQIFGLSSVTIDGEVFEITAYTDAVEDATAKAGDTRLSFSILREFSDFGGGEKPFLLYSGCEVSSWNLSAAANGLAKSTFSFFGRNMLAPATAAPVNSSVAPAIDTAPFDTFSGQMDIDGVESCIVTDYSLTINNGHAPRYGIGCQNSQDPSVNQSVVEGSITAYFNDASLYEKFVNEESLALTLTLQDLQGEQMIISLPNLKIGSGTQPDVSGDGPITITVNFTAHKDDTLESHVSVRRLSPLAV